MTLKSASAGIITVILIIIASTILWGGQYMTRSLWEPDEARYTYVAREMHDSGTWFVPHRNGEPYAHKPPLMFWLINAGTWLTHGEFNGVSGRLPTLLGTILSLLAMWRIALLWYDRQTALYTLLILSTSFLFWHKAGTGQIDVLLLGLQLSALYLLFRDESGSSAKRLAVAFSLMGLAILAKGPVGLIVPVGIYVTASCFSGNWRQLLRRFWLWGIPLALAWPAAWLLMAWLTGGPPSYFHELIFAQNVGRAAGEFGGHNRPVFYYLKYLVVDFLPWTLLLPAAVMAHRKQGGDAGQARRILGWILFVVVFFSLVRSKRNLYILSVYPALSMFLASALTSLSTLSPRWRKWVVYPIVVLLSLFAAAGLVLIFPLPGVHLPVNLPWHVPALFFFLLAAGAMALYRFQGQGGVSRHWISILIAVLILVEFHVGTVVFPLLNPVKSPLALAEAVEVTLPPDRPLILYRLHGEILALYAKRQGVRIDAFEDLTAVMEKTGFGIVTCYGDEWEALGKALEPFGCKTSPHFFDMGSKKLMWFEYTCPAQSPSN
ncbi:MAG: glycosyltransferase family 39 protein [Pseudomonadota bacterium]